MQSGEVDEEKRRKVEEGKKIARGIRGMNAESPAVVNGPFLRFCCSPPHNLARND